MFLNMAYLTVNLILFLKFKNTIFILQYCSQQILILIFIFKLMTFNNMLDILIIIKKWS
jgi:hypothetical protein